MPQFQKKEPPAPVVEFTPVPSRRFGLPDLHDKGPWLLSRLRVKYPHLQDKQLFGWIRGMIDSPESMFLRTEHAVMLAQIEHESLSALPTVIERFVLVETADAMHEGTSLYVDMMRWARGLNAERMYVHLHSDVPLTHIEERLGGLMAQRRMFAKVSP